MSVKSFFSGLVNHTEALKGANTPAGQQHRADVQAARDARNAAEQERVAKIAAEKQAAINRQNRQTVAIEDLTKQLDESNERFRNLPSWPPQ